MGLVVLAPSEVDYVRAQLLTDRPALSHLICTTPAHRTFECAHRFPSRSMRPPAKQLDLEAHLERVQLRFTELRCAYLTSKRVEHLRAIARELPRIDDTLSAYATGFLAGSESRLYALCFEPVEFGGELEGAPCAYCAELVRRRRRLVVQA